MAEPTDRQWNEILSTFLPAYNDLHGTSYDLKHGRIIDDGGIIDYQLNDGDNGLNIQHVRATDGTAKRGEQAKIEEFQESIKPRLTSVHVSWQFKKVPRNEKQRNDLGDAVVKLIAQYMPVTSQIEDIYSDNKIIAEYIKNIDLIPHERVSFGYNPYISHKGGYLDEVQITRMTVRKKEESLISNARCDEATNVVLLIDFEYSHFDSRFYLPDVQDMMKEEPCSFNEAWVVSLWVPGKGAWKIK